MIQWSIRLASVAVTALVAYGWGDFATDPGPLEVLVLIGLTIVLVAALHRLYRPGGVAAFEWDDERAGAPAAPAASAPPARVSGPEPAAVPPPPVPRSAPRPTGSLWSGERNHES